MARLTDTKVRRTRPGANDKWLADGGGLYLRISPGGARSWWFRKSRRGQRIQDRIGGLEEYTLGEARQKAATLALQNIGAGTVANLAERWFADCIEPEYRRPHHVRGYLDRAIVPELGNKLLRKITRADVVDMLARYKPRGTVAANNLRRVARQLFAYGVEIGWLESSPAEGISRRVCGAEAAAGTRVLSDDELRNLWRADSPHRALFRLLLVTGLRIGEAQQARWGQVADDRLHIPAEHSKNGRAHWVSLPELVRQSLGERGDDDALILPTVSPTAVQSWLKRYCEREKIAPPFTPHDLRRSCATRMAEMGTAPHVVEKCLNHTLQGVMATYNRAEHEAERVTATEAWADEIERLLGMQKRKVVRMRPRR